MWTHPNTTAAPTTASAAFSSAVIDLASALICEQVESVEWERVPCEYCGGKLAQLAESGNRDFVLEDGESASVEELVVCQRCGWWTIVALDLEVSIDFEDMYAVNRRTMWPTRYSRPKDGAVELHTGQLSGCLASLEDGKEEIVLPLAELQRYLLARPEARFRVSPRKFESLVGSIFRNTGHDVIETTQSRDGGIDLFLVDGIGKRTVAVQVKRYREKVGVEIIREFRGALLEHPGVVRGVVVTSSQFTRDAARAAKLGRPVPIALVDGRRLLEALGCSIRPAYSRENMKTAEFARHWARSIRREDQVTDYLPKDIVSNLAERADTDAMGHGRSAVK